MEQDQGRAGTARVYAKGAPWVLGSSAIEATDWERGRKRDCPQVVDGRSMIVNEPWLHLVDGADGGSGDESLVSGPCCISLMAELTEDVVE